MRAHAQQMTKQILREFTAGGFPAPSNYSSFQAWFSSPTKKEQRKRKTVCTPALFQFKLHALCNLGPASDLSGTYRAKLYVSDVCYVTFTKKG